MNVCVGAFAILMVNFWVLPSITRQARQPVGRRYRQQGCIAVEGAAFTPRRYNSHTALTLNLNTIAGVHTYRARALVALEVSSCPRSCRSIHLHFRTDVGDQLKILPSAVWIVNRPTVVTIAVPTDWTWTGFSDTRPRRTVSYSVARVRTIQM
jgi:hypothetical protein